MSAQPFFISVFIQRVLSEDFLSGTGLSSKYGVINKTEKLMAFRNLKSSGYDRYLADDHLSIIKFEMHM